MTTERLRIGAAGEQVAADHLIARGYRILERNFRTGSGEIDIVALGERANVILFVEVKTRLSTGRELDPMLSIGPAKRRQVRRVAGQWLHARPARPRVADLRFDAIGVVLGVDGQAVRLEHLEGAF